ncbi:MAG: DNA repair protein RecN, partial [Firmicutes bacterium]|nr:DNA repair protein RecN [Bacillota bacterium]
SICKGIADIHGQYDHQSLLDPENHLEILDLFGDDRLQQAKQQTSASYQAFTKAAAELAALRKNLKEAQRQRDLLSMEVADIEAARLQPEEDILLEEQIAVMQHSEQIYQNLSASYQSLFSGETNALDAIGDSVSRLQSVEGFSADIKALTEELSDLYYRIDDLNNGLRHMIDRVSFSPAQLDDAIERLEQINRIKRKFGGTVEAALSYAENAKAQLEDLENSDEKIRSLEQAFVTNKNQYDSAAARLTELRRQTADLLCRNVNRELTELNFKNAIFDVSFRTGTPSENGSDLVEFLISANKGEELRPLAKVASGGELSRIMLALKRIIGDLDGIPTMIFDEIDTGISGATAGIVGEKLRSIAKSHQIICITHLPQIAAMGDHHYLIKKMSDDSSTRTTVVPLSQEERLEELARLLSGTEITDSARAQAAELLQQSR